MWWKSNVEINSHGTQVYKTRVPMFTWYALCSSSSSMGSTSSSDLLHPPSVGSSLLVASSSRGSFFFEFFKPWVLLSSSNSSDYGFFFLQILQIFFFFFFRFFYGTQVLETQISHGKNLHISNQNSSLWGSSFFTEPEPHRLEMLICLIVSKLCLVTT